jgi:FMN phosphatase YigB (HAD superfamily)
VAKIKGLVFDSDGTLFKVDGFIPLFAQIMRKALYQCTGKYSFMGLRDMYPMLSLPLADSIRMIRKMGIEPHDYWGAVFILDLETRERVFGDRIRPFNDVSVLNKLKGKYKMGILSNTPEQIIEFQLDKAGLNGGMWAGKVCGFYKSVACKPEVFGFYQLLKQMKLGPREVVMIGDSDVDVEAGKRIGAKTIKIDRGHYDYGGPEPDFIIKSLEELEEVLCKLEGK